jgi:hypothetical protein
MWMNLKNTMLWEKESPTQNVHIICEITRTGKSREKEADWQLADCREGGIASVSLLGAELPLWVMKMWNQTEVVVA